MASRLTWLRGWGLFSRPWCVELNQAELCVMEGRRSVCVGFEYLFM